MRQFILIMGLCFSGASCYQAEEMYPDASDEEDPPTATVDLRLSSYSGHSCKVTDDNTIYCWGNNDYGQLGDGTTEFRLVQVLVEGIMASDVSVGFNHTCALLVSGRVACWGRSDYGQAGVASQEVVTEPTLIEGLSDIVQVAGGAHYSCALDGQGEIYCWGMANVEGEGNGYGDWELGETGPRPVQMPRIESIDYIRASGHTTCAVTTYGNAMCWGAPLTPEDADASSGSSKLRSVLPEVEDLSLGNGYLCFIDPEHRLWCGANSTKLVAGLFLTDEAGIFDEVSSKSGNGPVCARTTAGEVYCITTPLERAFAGLEQVPDLASATAITTGNEFFCAILDSGETTCQHGSYTATGK